MTFKTRFNPHPPRKYAFVPKGTSLTQQQFKEECDVNNILAKYKKTGMISHINKHQGNFGDFSSVEDYQTSLDKLTTAQDSFNHLPSELRNRFENDPAKLIEFLQSKENYEESIKLGLRKKPVPSTQEVIENALDAHEAKKASRTKKD